MTNQFIQLLGKTMKNVSSDQKTMTFEREDGEEFRFFHQQECCEEVYIEDICGELGDLVGSPLIVAEENNSERHSDDHSSTTWTFYRFATIKGHVTVRWCGVSNGYYSEQVSFR